MIVTRALKHMTRTTQLAVATGLGGQTSLITTLTPAPTPYGDSGLPYRSVPPVAAPLVAVTTTATATATAAENTTTSKKSSAQPMATTKLSQAKYYNSA